MRITSLVGVAVTVLAFGSQANASILQLQCLGSTSSVTQTDGGTWVSELAGGYGVTYTNLGGTGITVAYTSSADNSRARSGTPHTSPIDYSNLYTGVWLRGTTLQFSGLDSNKVYTLQIFSYDISAGSTNSSTFAVVTGTVTQGDTSHTVTYATPSAANNFDSYTFFVQPASGVVKFNLSGTYAGGGEINGVIIDTAPEPATMGLLAIGGLAAVIRRRRA